MKKSDDGGVSKSRKRKGQEASRGTQDISSFFIRTPRQDTSSSSSSSRHTKTKRIIDDDDDIEEIKQESEDDFKKKSRKTNVKPNEVVVQAPKVSRKKGDINVKALPTVTAAAMFGSDPIKKSSKSSTSKSKEPNKRTADDDSSYSAVSKRNEGKTPVKTKQSIEDSPGAASIGSSKSNSRSSSKSPKKAAQTEVKKERQKKFPDDNTLSKSKSPNKTPTLEKKEIPSSSLQRTPSPKKRHSETKTKESSNIHKESGEMERKSKSKIDDFRKPRAVRETEITPKRSASSISKREPSASSSSSSSKKVNEKTPNNSTKKSTKDTPELTPEEKDKKRKQQSSYFKHLSRGGPKNLGSKEIPVGAIGCMNGLTFVLTGVLDSLEREDVTEIVNKYGGRVTGSISGKTTHLIVGEEAGESKTKKANSLKIPLISEDDFLEMLRKSNPNQPESQTIFGCSDDDEDILSEMELDSLVSKSPPKGSPSKDSGVGSSQSQRIVTPQSEPPSKLKISRRGGPPPVQQEQRRVSTLMWVDKYKPSSLKNVVGQAGEKSNAQKLSKWLRNWFQFHGKSGEKAKAAYPGMKDPEGKTLKAALLSGPPGIGKTSTAHLACKEIGYDFFEMNASDTRNKKGLHEIAADALTSKSILHIGDTNELTSKHVLIMDEVDGMSGNEDRGGIQELINLIKTSRVPVICICNDRNHQKIRSLANYCFDLRFNKPTNEQLKGLVQSVCYKEKLKVPLESVQQLINSSDHDIRQILNQLELLKECSSTHSICSPKKDLKFGPWDVCRKVFSASEHKGMSIHDKNNLFFQDYSFGPLFVQENYLKWTPLKAKGNRFKALDLMKRSSEAIATGDLVDNLIRKSNNWSLLPTQAVFSSILPGEYMEGNEVSGIEFPRWLGKNSNRGKLSRLLQQLHTHVHLEVSGSLEALNMDYLPYLRRSIVNPLAAGNVETAVRAMQNYSLMREDLDNINELAMWPGMKNPLEKLESKMKASFTRQLNKELMVPYSVIKITKGRERAAGAAEDVEGLEDDEVNEEEEEEGEEKIEKDAMIRIRKKTKTSASSSKGSKAKISLEDDEEDDEDEDEPKPSRPKSSSGSKRKAGRDNGGSASISKRTRT